MLAAGNLLDGAGHDLWALDSIRFAPEASVAATAVPEGAALVAEPAVQWVG
jgi:hypothetical protein